MKKKNDRFSVEIVSGLQAIEAKELRPTAIIEDNEDGYPYAYCALPENFFDFGLAREAAKKETTLLSIDSWDGREIFSVVRKH